VASGQLGTNASARPRSTCWNLEDREESEFVMPMSSVAAAVDRDRVARVVDLA